MVLAAATRGAACGRGVIYLSGAERPELRAAAADGCAVGVMVERSGGWQHRRLSHYRAYAADNGCYAAGDRFDLAAYLAWLATLPHRDRCLFAVAPDVLGDAAATWTRSAPVLPQLRALDYRAALVAQDGFDAGAVDWDAFDALFVGGTDAYKLSEAAYMAVQEAKRREKWTHMGRVNSLRRLRAAVISGYDSADGTFIKFGPDKNLPQLLDWLAHLERQLRLGLWEAAS